MECLSTRLNFKNKWQMYVLFEVHLALLENSLVILMKFGECSTIMCLIGVKIPGGAQILVTPIRGGVL